MTVMTTEAPLSCDQRAEEWQQRYPSRWAREIADLSESGWTYRVTRQSSGIGLLVSVPLSIAVSNAVVAGADGDPRREPLVEPACVRLQVRFPQTYPAFPPDVIDIDGTLAGLRHRNPISGELCLLHDEHWHADLTVAALVARQLPRLLATHALDATSPAPEGLEFPVPEAAPAMVNNRRQPIIVTDTPVPPGVDGGVLLARFARSENRLGAGVIEAVLGAGVDLRSDLPTAQLDEFRLPVLGRWLRDPDYTLGETPHATWRRIKHRLAPLEVNTLDDKATALGTDFIDLVGLLVPDETTYRSRGESWMFLMRLSTGPHRRRRKVILLGTQYFSRALLAERTPVTETLADKHVVVIGLGAVGMPIALDLAQSGVGTITVLDHDHVDPITTTRQASGPVSLAGIAKVSLARTLIEDAAPYCSVRAIRGPVEGLWDRHGDSMSDRTAQQMRRALLEADVVIDATATPPVARLLDRVRASVGKPLLVASGTAGGWGGVVAMLTPESGCWSCVEHARLDHLLPVPPAKKDGWVTPTRCAAVTFTGERHQMQQIALHASAVTIAHLAGNPMEGDYYVASMRTPQDRPTPIRWTSATLPIHPSCPLHEPADAADAADAAHAVHPAVAGFRADGVG